MHVASVLGYLAPKYGGPPTVAIKLGRQLEKYGFISTLWATATPAERLELAYLGSKANLFDAKFPRSWYRSRRLQRELNEQAPEIDLFHLHQIWDYPIQAAARIARRNNKPYLVTPHGIFAQSWRYASPKKRLYLRFIARSFLNRAACVHAVTYQELKGFKDVGLRTQYTVIPNGVAIEEYYDLPTRNYADVIWPCLNGKQLVLYLGRLSPEKGLDKLISAWPAIIAKNNRAFLMIAGPDFGQFQVSLETQIRRLGLGKSVVFPGLLRGTMKKAALSRADVYVQPSYSEVMGISVLEALCCAKPAVVTTGCNFPEVSEVCAGEVVDLTANALGNAITKLLSLSDRERAEMGARGKELVDHKYTLDMAVRKMLTVYRCILDHNPIPLYPEPIDVP